METKQVIVMRRDLQMRRGKEIAQGSHASMMFLLNKYDNQTPPTEEELLWKDGMMTKVCVRVDSEEELIIIYDKALEAGLTAHMITDAGKTEFNGVPTRTCCAIGPHEVSKIDAITRELKLY